MTQWVPIGKARLEEAQAATGLSDERLARTIPVSAKTWSRWKKRGEVPAAAIPAVANALGLEVKQVPQEPLEIPTVGEAAAVGADWLQVLAEIRELRELVVDRLPRQEDAQEAVGLVASTPEERQKAGQPAPATSPASERASGRRDEEHS